MPQSQPLTPERVFASPALSGPAARGAAVSPDGRWLTWLKPSPEEQSRLDLWIAPVAGGEGRRLVAGEALEPAGQALSEEEKARRERMRLAQLRGVIAYEWDEASRRLLIPAGGALWLAEASTGDLARLPLRAPGALDPRLSPGGGFVAFVREQNLFTLEIETGEERALTTEGGGPVSFGVAEFVAQEEMGRFTGYWISPDERFIAYTRVDEGPVEVIERLEIGAEGSTIVPQRYPRAGRPNARVRLFIRPLHDGTGPVEADLGADTDVYLARAAWAADGAGLYVQRQSRDQKALDLLSVDPRTGRSAVILEERQEPWIDLHDDFRPLTDGTFLWGSARSGAHHLYLHARDGRLIRALTSGPVPCGGAHAGGGARAPSLAGVDEARGLAYVLASLETPIERRLYAVPYREAGAPRPLTPAGGWWTAVMPRSAGVFIGYYSDPLTPPQAALYEAGGKRLRWIEENRLDADHPFHPYADRYPAPEFGTLEADDGQDLHYVLLKPVGFDPRRRHPAIVEVYGGPGVQTVTRSWRGMAEKLFLEAGFVLLQLDNRGSAGRDVRFQGAIARRLGSVEVDDQVKGLELLRALPFVDPERIGVTGWSYGGYMTLRMLTDPRTRLRCGAAGAPPTDWREYDTHYTERYMGRPQDDPAAYDAAAVIPRLGSLSGRLLLLHGMADDNVLVSNAFSVMAALQEAGTPFDLMLFPGQRHGVVGETRQLQLWRTFLEFFRRELAPA